MASSKLLATLDTSTPFEIRRRFRLSAAIPPQVEEFAIQEQRCLKQLASKSTDLEKFTYLSMLRINQTHLFYRLVLRHFTELTPLIYTPVVGEACLQWSEIYQKPEGMYLSYDRHRGHLTEVLQEWPQESVAMTVITDGSRILGLGDLGVNGMGIPIGKLSLYVACAGIRPEQVLPITIDLGTGNKEFRDNKLYLGSRREKNTREEEEEFLDELMPALKARWPKIVIQFEDWKYPFYSLEKYAPKYTMFNDDIQGTGAVIMGGIMSAIKQSSLHPRKHRAVFFGAGSAAVGVAKQIIQYLIYEGLSEDEARSRFWLVDRKGLVTSDRGDTLPEHKEYFSRHDINGKQYSSLEDTLDFVEPTILIGLSGVRGAFAKGMLKKMAQWNKLPIIFPLSNPLTHSECTFSEAIIATEGRVLFASGSPFSHVPFRGGDYHPAQGNNMYVFPGIGLGAILSKATRITDNMIYASGAALPEILTSEEVSMGLLYPAIERIREVSVRVARGVIRGAQRDGVDQAADLKEMSDETLDAYISGKMYDPSVDINSTAGMEGLKGWA